jgi:hypothetical protein
MGRVKETALFFTYQRKRVKEMALFFTYQKDTCKVSGQSAH